MNPRKVRRPPTTHLRSMHSASQIGFFISLVLVSSGGRAPGQEASDSLAKPNPAPTLIPLGKVALEAQSGVASLQGIDASPLQFSRRLKKGLVATRSEVTLTTVSKIDPIQLNFPINRRVRQALGFRLKQPARELVFQTDTRRAEFSAAPLADAAPAQGRLMLGTVRSHDQWNTTIYSDDDRYRGVKNLRTLIFMNEEDMWDPRLD